jgi:hypothetical protein
MLSDVTAVWNKFMEVNFLIRPRSINYEAVYVIFSPSSCLFLIMLYLTTLSPAQTKRRITGWLMNNNWKGYGKMSCPNLRYCPDICLKGLRKTNKTCQDSQSLVRDFKQRPAKSHSFLSSFRWSCGSSGSIVSDSGLDDRGSIPDRGRGFFF